MIVNGADQHRRPFRQPRYFLQQAFVLDQFEAQGERFLPDFVQDDLLALCGVQDHMRVAQFLHVIVEAANLDDAF